MTRLNHEIEDAQAEVLDLYSRLRSKNDQDQPQQTMVVMQAPQATEMVAAPKGMSHQLAGAILGPKDQKLIAKGTANYKQRFQELWGGGNDEGKTANEGDLALCNMLSVLTRRNAGEIDRLVRLSGRMRDKWNEVHYADGRTYGEVTIEKAISGGLGASESPQKAAALKAAAFHLTDVGNGQRLAARHGRDLRYCSSWGKWFRWNGSLWVTDKTDQVMQLAKETVRSIYSDVANTTDEHVRSELLKHATRSEKFGSLKSMIGSAQSEGGVAISPEEFDQDPWLFNCHNGTLDLRTGEFKGHRRRDLITKLAPVAFDPAALCPRWLDFLKEVMAGNENKISYLQKAAGYSLTGLTREQCLFLFWGYGRNGKTTFLETLKALIGSDYATQAASETFTQRGRGQILSDLAAMRGSRLVTLPDFEKGERLNEALIKQVTGGDQVRARYLYGEWFTYTPQFKLWLMGNHKPEIRDAGDGMWRRIRLVEFAVKVPNPDRTLADKLVQELPGILNWAIQGCLDWQKDGLRAPKEVQDATAGYQAEMDVLGGFLEACCIQKPAAVTPTATIYEAYTQWAAANQEAPMKKVAFGQALTERGFVRKHGRKGSLRQDVAVKAGGGHGGCGPAAPGSGG